MSRTWVRFSAGATILRFGRVVAFFGAAIFRYFRDVDYIRYISRLNALTDCIPRTSRTVCAYGHDGLIALTGKRGSIRMNYNGPNREGEKEKKTGKEVHIASKLEQIVRQSGGCSASIVWFALLVVTIRTLQMK